MRETEAVFLACCRVADSAAGPLASYSAWWRVGQLGGWSAGGLGGWLAGKLENAHRWRISNKNLRFMQVLNTF